MLVRLLLALLLAVSATPASAAGCHDAAPSAPAAHQVMPSGGEHRRDAAAPHACVGCIPPSDWLAARVRAPVLVPVARPLARVARLDLGRGLPPALPPPRSV